MSLTGSTTTSGLPAGFECAGAGGYDDIIPGTEVTVSDESGTILGKGELSSSTGGSGYCDFEFTIHDVPRGKHFYDVEVSQRGALSFTEEEAESGLSLTLGT
ncbi:hypothetical protein ERC79_17940 [Rhodococcus sp. ABRD24]|nr:hypothetical protein ERC79_17940 [Rhodococcus sp. ABRD24]